MSNRTHHSEDTGSALLIAIMSVGVCLAISLVGISVALTATRSSGVDRQRVLAINAAEAGVDATYTMISNGGAQPPCGISPTSVSSGPDTATFTTTVSYLAAGGAALACDAAGAVVGVPASAVIRSRASTNTLAGGSSRGDRTMEALVNLVPATALGKAILADGNLDFTNKTTITGNNGTDADIYSNKSVTCANNENFAGNVYSQGDVVIQNTCTFAAGVWAAGKVTTSGGTNGTIAGFVKAGGGPISLSGVTVAGNLYAAGSITYGGCSAAGKCFPNSNPGPPPAVPFPIIRGDSASLAAWTAPAPGGPGYTTYVDNSCSGLKDRIVSTYAKKGTPTVLSTTCPVAFDGDKKIILNNDLAIFAVGGFTSSRQVSFESSSPGSLRLLHWIVPYTAATVRPCTAPAITTDQQFGLDADVDMFLYSPCNISFSNNSTHVGQIYGGSDVTINNQFNLTYRPVPVYGYEAASVPATSFTPSIVYKRENR